MDSTGRSLSDLLGLGKGLLRRIEVLITLAAACALLLPATQSGLFSSLLAGPIEWIALGVILLSLYVTCRSVRLYIARDRARLASLEREAQLKGASAVAETLQDRIGNKLAVTAGYSELLLDDPSLPDHVHAHAERIMNSSLAAARTMKAALHTARLNLEAAAHPDKVPPADRRPDPRRAGHSLFEWKRR
jgi:hypothetical protein